MNSVFVGCGYVGRQVAARELIDGGTAEAVVRTDESASRLGAMGIQATARDLEAGIPSDLRFGDKALYWFAPPQPDGVQDRRIRRFFASINNQHGLPTRVVLISTTGVYGDCGGDWVTEERERRPQTGRAHRRVDAEDFMRDWCATHHIILTVLRVPGIYGAGKLPLERIQQKRPVLAPDLCPWSNRVHVEDLISACLMAARNPAPASVYNVSDGHPSTMTDFFFKVAEAAGLERPPTLDLDQARETLSAEMRSYLDESKRIDNTLMREHLGVQVQFPDLDAGLSQIFAHPS